MTENALFDAAEATWPAARKIACGPLTLRDGQGGGKRVSAATANAKASPDDLKTAEAMMRDMGQDPLFQIRPDEVALDQQLGDLGYQIIDPVDVMTVPIQHLTETPPPPISAFALDQPLAIQHQLWSDCGIGPGRWAVMDRAQGPKSYILGRAQGRAAGAVFAAIDQKTVFCHALEVLPAQRRQGSASYMLRAAAIWAQEQGAETAGILVLQGNASAKALFSSLGFVNVGHYHYRIRPSTEDRA